MNRDHRLLRVAIGASGLFFLTLAAGFIVQSHWAVSLWPWSDDYGGAPNNHSLLFMGSIAAAIATPALWISWSGDLAAGKAGGVNLGITFGAVALYLLLEHARIGGDRLLWAAVVMGWLAAGSLITAWWVARIPLRDQRTTPTPVRLAFGVLSITLLILGALLVSKTPNVLPWNQSDQSSVVYGWVFLGASVYFALALLETHWPHAAGALLGFLAYDLVLILPFLQHYGDVLPEHRTSLIVYTTVLLLTAGLAIFYLFIHRRTRLAANLATPSARGAPLPHGHLGPRRQARW